MQDVSERVKKLLVELYCAKPDMEIHDHSTLRGDLDMDSLDAVEFIMALEDEFMIDIEDADSEKMVTYGDVVDYIEKRLS